MDNYIFFEKNKKKNTELGYGIDFTVDCKMNDFRDK